MKEYIKQKEVQNIKKVKSIICDSCKKKDTDIDWSDITSININFGFGSKYDTEQWTIDLCDECIDKLILPIKEDQ